MHTWLELETFFKNISKLLNGNVCAAHYLFRSSTGRPDWTCIVVGFSSGYVRFYTEVLQCFLIYKLTS